MIFFLYVEHKRPPFKDNITKYANCFDLVHMYIWGPLKFPYMFGYKYILTIFYDYSRLCWIYPMKLKSEAYGLVKLFIAYVKTQFNTRVNNSIW